MNDWKCYPASLDDFEDMRIVLDEVADTVMIPPDIMIKLELGFEEAVVNVINYSGSDRIWIKVAAVDNRFNIEIVDHGVAFNPLVVNDPRASDDSPLDEREPGGFGIFLIKQTFDELDYRREMFEGAPANHLSLALRLDGDDAQT